MLAAFQSVSPLLKLRTKIVSIDNIAFKIHYRTTFLILIVATILVTSRAIDANNSQRKEKYKIFRTQMFSNGSTVTTGIFLKASAGIVVVTFMQYIGEHIKCIVDGTAFKDFEKFIETFCFFTTTFTVNHHFNQTALAADAIPHPGIGPHTNEPIKRHAYYQWVPFVLFLQAISFYVPHYVWKKYEGGRIFRLVNGLKMQSFSKYLKAKQDMKIGEKEFLSQDTVDGRLVVMKTNFLGRLHHNKNWGRVLIACELWNLLNIFFQIYLTNEFLGGQFYDLGSRFVAENWTSQMDFLDEVFPKMTKCSFWKYGPSGSLQLHDAMCVMALNIINEKIYSFLWFWFLFVAIISMLALLWRLLTMSMYKKSSRFNGMVFNLVCPGRIRPDDLQKVIEVCEFSNWLYLVYLASNMDSHVFIEFIRLIVEESRESSDEAVENRANHMTEGDENHDTVDGVPTEQHTLTHEKDL